MYTRFYVYNKLSETIHSLTSFFVWFNTLFAIVITTTTTITYY